MCGAARKFQIADGSYKDFVTFTCLWDKTWSPGDFSISGIDKEYFQIYFRASAASLRLGGLSSTSKSSKKFQSTTGLVTKTHFLLTEKITFVRDGKPIGFGQSVAFVCERGMAFEDDFFRESVEFSCQVSTMIFIYHLISLGRIGWEYSPRLFLGSWDRWGVAQMCHRWNIFYLIWQKTTIWNPSGPICEPPPPLPFEGEVTVSVREKELDKVKTCEVKSGIICSDQS